MKKLIAVGTAILILLVVLAGCSKNNSVNNDGNDGGVNKVYSFSGGNESIAISNGSIVLTPTLELFVGGQLSFMGAEPQNIKSYTAKFYFYLDSDSVETDIHRVTALVENPDLSVSIASDMGSTSAEKIFNSDDVWDIITAPGGLHFSLSGTLMDGKTFEYNIILNVTEV